jgi:7-cyano-7-deazaguanine synthase
MENTKQKVLLLFSGGLDSTLLLKLALDLGFEPICLGFNYGQIHLAELTKARDLCNELGVLYRTLEIPLQGSKLTDDDVSYEGVSEWHVPARNLVFISLAASYAESKGIDLIWYGANYADRLGLFPDCYQEWIVKLNDLLAINGSLKIRVEAPLIGWSKELIEAYAEKRFDLTKNKVHSGYGRE